MRLVLWFCPFCVLFNFQHFTFQPHQDDHKYLKNQYKCHKFGMYCSQCCKNKNFMAVIKTLNNLTQPCIYETTKDRKRITLID